MIITNCSAHKNILLTCRKPYCDHAAVLIRTPVLTPHWLEDILASLTCSYVISSFTKVEHSLPMQHCSQFSLCRLPVTMCVVWVIFQCSSAFWLGLQILVLCCHSLPKPSTCLPISEVLFLLSSAPWVNISLQWILTVLFSLARMNYFHLLLFLMIVVYPFKFIT